MTVQASVQHGGWISRGRKWRLPVFLKTSPEVTQLPFPYILQVKAIRGPTYIQMGEEIDFTSHGEGGEMTKKQQLTLINYSKFMCN